MQRLERPPEFSMKLANERREKPRINLKGTAFVFDSHGRQQVTLRNLSSVGVLVEVAQAPTKGATVHLGICLDGKSWIELVGRVKRIIKKGGAHECAIDLRYSTADARESLESYVQRVVTALSLAKQREIFAKRMAGMEQGPPPPTRDELIRQALPSAVLPPGSSITTPPKPMPVAVGGPRPTPKATPAIEPEKPDRRLASLYRQAVQDLDRKR
jgi:hypothetical protein